MRTPPASRRGGVSGKGGTGRSSNLRNVCTESGIAVRSLIEELRAMVIFIKITAKCLKVTMQMFFYTFLFRNVKNFIFYNDLPLLLRAHRPQPASLLSNQGRNPFRKQAQLERCGRSGSRTR
jgi:hypothetical protein